MDMKKCDMTIEERAIEYCKEQWDEPTAMTAYMDGAIEQKAIDIDKACDWLKERVQCGVHPQRAYGFAEEFRKAMEK